MGFGAPSATPCLAGFFALRCFSLITIWVTPESWVVKPITSLPHWFYTRILRVPKCFSPQAFSLTPKSAHNLGVYMYVCPARAHGSLSPKIAVLYRSNADCIHALTAENPAVLRRG